MLVSLMYHHINGDKFSNTLETFETHLKYLIGNYTFVVPGDTLTFNKKNICLTFDDAYYDFYHYVFPLLKRYEIKAVLAVPTALINDKVTASIEKRLSLRHDEIYVNKNYRNHGIFCTWDELKEMHDSGYVVMASHSYKHKDLAKDGVDLYQEIVDSKRMLEDKLETQIDSFILPFGRYNYNAIKLLKQHYQYIFKVGQGINYDFKGVNGLIYRIDADNREDIKALFTMKQMFSYGIKSLLKSFHDGLQKPS